MSNNECSPVSETARGRLLFKKLLPLLGLLVPLALVAFVAGRSPSGVRPFVLVGSRSPLVSAVTLDSKTYENSGAGWRMIHFWTSTCSECRGEVPELRRFIENQNKSPSPIELLNVNIQDSLTTVGKYAAEFDLPQKVLLDTDGKMARSFGVTGVPETFFIDPSGIVRHHMVGASTTDEFERVLELLQKSTNVSKPL